MSNRILSGVFLMAITTIGGCGGDDAGEESIDLEGCEHLQEGPPVPVTATVDDTAPPTVADDHMRYDVTLVAVTGGNGGFVSFAADEAGDFVFFMDEDVPIHIFDGDGSEVVIEESVTSSEHCTEIKGKHTVELEVGTYEIELGPTTASEVGIVIEHGGAHADE